MNIYCTQQEALKKLQDIRPAETIATFFEAIFPNSVSFGRRALLLCDSLALFEEHWTGLTEQRCKFSLITPRIYSEKLPPSESQLLRVEASFTHAAELQTQMAALEAKLANPKDKI